MKSIDALEAQFAAELSVALRRTAKGQGPTLFSLGENGSRSSARKLRAKAERIMELRQSYSVDRSKQSPAARYLAACLVWEHSGKRDAAAAKEVAATLLQEIGDYAT